MTNKTIMMLAAIVTIGKINAFEKHPDTTHQMYLQPRLHFDPCNLPDAPLLKPQKPVFYPPFLDLKTPTNNDSLFEMLPIIASPTTEALSNEVLDRSFISPVTERVRPLSNIKKPIPLPRSKE